MTLSKQCSLSPRPHLQYGGNADPCLAAQVLRIATVQSVCSTLNAWKCCLRAESSGCGGAAVENPCPFEGGGGGGGIPVVNSSRLVTSLGLWLSSSGSGRVPYEPCRCPAFVSWPLATYKPDLIPEAFLQGCAWTNISLLEHQRPFQPSWLLGRSHSSRVTCCFSGVALFPIAFVPSRVSGYKLSFTFHLREPFTGD